MDIVKKNMWSIVCGVVALLAVASTYFPLSGKFVELNTKLQSSADEDRKFKTLNGLNPNMPVVDPKTSEPKKLGQFPTERVIEKGRLVVGKVHTEAEKLQQKAMEMNQRQPLVANALIVGREPWMSSFKQDYYAAMDQLRKDLDATTVPTEFEINQKIEQTWKDEWEPMINKVGDVAQNDQQVRQEFEEAKKDIPKRMRYERSLQHVMYVNPEKPGPTPGTTTGMTPSFYYHTGIPPADANALPNAVDVWQAQLGYWIQEDVVRAIIETNKSANAKTVDDAIVKRLIRTAINMEYVTPTGPLAIATAGNPSNIAPANQPGQPQDTATTGPPKSFGYTVTGRVCNPSYDVMHFTVTVDADAQRFQTFINNLTRGKFITILRVNLRGVDRERIQQTSFYYYGRQPVVRMEIKCEAIFFRSWTVDPQHPLMPLNVQKLLRIQQTPTGVAENR
jgi:hypothetical protein